MWNVFFASIATILVTSSYIPQIIRGYKTKKLDDVSMGFLVILSIGLFCWIFYGIVNGDTIFIIANIFNLSFALGLLGMKLYYGKYRKKQ